MRLTKFEADTIKQSIYRDDPGAMVYLFGSRVDDAEKGGDIDLLIIPKKIKSTDKIKLKAALFEKLEEQKIDLVIAETNEKPFVRIALGKRVLL
jgi:uncharacterized protein